jgi:hypothetical protein
MQQHKLPTPLIVVVCGLVMLFGFALCLGVRGQRAQIRAEHEAQLAKTQALLEQVTATTQEAKQAGGKAFH